MRVSQALAVIACVVVCGVVIVAAVDDRPIIGVLTLPTTSKHGASYFPASYVKWIESGGARVSPIKFTDSKEDIVAQVKSLNGVLWTGGGAMFFNADGSLTEFAAAADTILNTVVELNKAGTHMPLWATCLGFELLNVLAAGPNGTVLHYGFDSENLALALDPTDNFASSRMMTAAGSTIQKILTSENVTMNNHQAGIPASVWTANPVLSGMFDLVSTNEDRKGVAFASTMEGKDLPLYATQWHPEKVQFEWNPKEVIPHTEDAVTANSFFARWLGSEARKNSNAFPSLDDELAALIYHYTPVYTYPSDPGFEQCYYFDK